MRSLVLFAFLAGLAGPHALFAQGWGTIEGRVTEAASGLPLPNVTVVVDGTNFGTATEEAGTYRLRLPAGRHALRFSAVGFAPHIDSVAVVRDEVVTLNAALRDTLVAMDGVTVESAAPTEAGVHEIRPEHIQDMPMPLQDGLRALKVMPGVATNNELSNQYSVRGGGFNENLIFINGFEVYLPFRPRQGEQEGLSLLNAELAERLTFYTGGFPARYGGKLSSALEVRYRRPQGERLRGTAYASLLDAGVTAGASAFAGRLGWTFGLRKARARRFFSTQELKGNYQPDYTDLQGTLAFRIAPGHELEALGMWAEHAFLLDPRSRKTYFGIVSADPTQPSNLQGTWTEYAAASEERDGYATRFGGIRLRSRLSSSLRLEHDLAYFGTEETERLDVSGVTLIYQVDPGGDPDTGTGHLPVGRVRQEEFADNHVRVSTLTGQGRALLTRRRHAAEAGWYVRDLRFDDRLQEKSAVVPLHGDAPERILVDSLSGSATLGALQAGLYAQDAFDVLPERDRLLLTAGLRADYFSFNDEWTLSPRLSARYRLSERTTLVGAWGIYYQAPTYRELRGDPLPGSSILEGLNYDIRAQRSVQYVVGTEYFLPRRRLYVRAEGYYKDLSRLISYDIDNVRVRYSGRNDAEGHVYGLDLQLQGEFVPGMESWVNYSYMVARERFLTDYQRPGSMGLLPRPTDQRHTFSAFVQDYVPTDPTWKIHLRGLFGSGLPYTPPVPGRKIGNVTVQEPGQRFSARYTQYMRVDLGATKHIVVFRDGQGNPFRLQLTAEVLNIFNMTNTVAYAWEPGADGIWVRVPTHLTPRTFNVRARMEF